LAALIATASGAACGGQDSGGKDTLGTEDVDETPDLGAPIDVSFDISGEDMSDGTTAPGGFLAPCLENSDCNSGYCVEGPTGSVCTRNCETECPEDWRCTGIQNSASDVVFLCLPLQNRLCLPCTVDLQCGSGYCLPDANNNASCTRPCGDGDSCPDGFECEDRVSLESETRTSKQCVPTTGLCDCNSRNAGEERPCPVANDFGRCWGTQTCNGNTGWTGCDAAVPAPELCDSIDQNCNGITDEGLTAPVETCTSENTFGTCQGAWTCAGEGGWSCEARDATQETCNYLDDNCNGSVDEAFRDTETGFYVADDHCGLCNSTCAGRVPFATATTCAIENGAPACIALTCQAGYYIPPETRQACIPAAGGGTDCSPCFGDNTCGGLPGGTCQMIDGTRRCARLQLFGARRTPPVRPRHTVLPLRWQRHEPP